MLTESEDIIMKKITGTNNRGKGGYKGSEEFMFEA